MTTLEKAESYRRKGYNCCQSVLCALDGLTGLNEDDAIAIGYGFGGGMHCGSVCGAVTGGLMAIGCACLRDRDQSVAATKKKSGELSTTLEEAFQGKYGTMLCNELTAAQGRLPCGGYIAFAAETAEKIIEGQK